MKKIVFIETNFSGLYAIEYCRNQNHQTVLITDSYERFKKWFPAASLEKLELVNQIITVSDSNDHEEVLAVIKNQVPDVDAVITFAEIRTKAVAKLCQTLGLKGSNVAAIEIAQDKFQFRNTLREKGVESVFSQKVSPSDLDCLHEDSLHFPCFVKPVQGHSSIGATVCQNLNDLRKIMKLLAQTKEDCISTSVVLEEYLVGPLLSVEVLTVAAGQHHVVGIADRDVLNHSIETGSSFPVKHPHQQDIERKACAALDAIGYDFGPSHIELILTKDGPYLVEINTRVGGSGHSLMLDLATARSIVGDCIELCLGQLHFASPPYQAVQGSAWKCFVHQQGGHVKKLPSAASIQAQEGVTDVWFHHDIGDHVDVLNSNFNWIVQVMCTGNDQVQAKKNAQAAVEFITANALIE